MLAFQPIMSVGMLETLNWLEKFLSSIWKHAYLMLFNGWCSFCNLSNTALVVVIYAGSANWGYIATAPGRAGSTKEISSRRASTIGDNTKPNHTRILLWGHMSCCRALWCDFPMHGRGDSVGRFLRNWWWGWDGPFCGDCVCNWEQSIMIISRTVGCRKALHNKQKVALDD